MQGAFFAASKCPARQRKPRYRGCVPPPRRLCPCHSTLRFTACCEPFLSRRCLPSRPEELMRSRYAGFALGHADYLVETLAAGHPDLLQPRAEYTQSLAQMHAFRRFMGLRVHGEWVDGDAGEVLFVARLFEGGQNVGFAELSSFIRADGRWGYARGTLIPLRELPSSELGDHTREGFLAEAHAREKDRPRG